MVIHGDGNSGGIFTDAVVGWFCRAHSVLYYGWGQTMMTSVLAFSLMYKIKGYENISRLIFHIAWGD